MATAQGRLTDAEKLNAVLNDDPSMQGKAVQSKLDEIIVALKAITAKLDADGGVTDADYASTITDSLNPITLKL